MSEKTENQRHIISSSSKKHNALWHWSKSNYKPYLAVKKKRKYAFLRYDMWTINHDLNEDVLKEINELRNKIVQKNFSQGGKKQVWSMVSKGSGYIDNVLINVAIEFLPELKKIVFNEDNWVPIDFTNIFKKVNQNE